MAQTFETSSIAASASSAPGPGAAVALLEEEPEQALLAIELDDVPGKLVRLVDLGRPRRDPLRRERAHEREQLALVVTERRPGEGAAGHDGAAESVIEKRGIATIRIPHIGSMRASAGRRSPRRAGFAVLIPRRGGRAARSRARARRARSAVNPAASASATQDSPSARSSASVARPERGEVEQHLAPVAGVGLALDEPCFLELAHRVGHRLRPNVLERRQPARRRRAFAVDPDERGHLGGGKRPVAAIAADELPDHGPQMARDLRDLGVAPDVSI